MTNTTYEGFFPERGKEKMMRQFLILVKVSLAGATRMDKGVGVIYQSMGDVEWLHH